MKYNPFTSTQHTTPYTWFMIPKTGTRSIYTALKKHTPVDYHRYSVEMPMDVQFINYWFTFVRNPYTRLVSAWQNKVEAGKLYPICKGKGFSFFVDFLTGLGPMGMDIHFRPQTAMLPPLELLDDIFRFENYEQDTAQLFAKLGIAPTLPHLNRSNWTGNLSDYYGDDTRRKVAEIYKNDFEQLNYQI